ncbi:MAG: YceD family protein [Hyphomicrobiaceae bacterium]
MSDPLSAWTHRVADVGERGVEAQRTATAAERGEIAAALDIPACDSLEVTYQIRPISGARFRMIGRLTADVLQSCVVTLEPVRSRIEEPLEEEFWPPDQISEAESGLDAEQEALAVTIAEPIENGRLEVGRVVYQRLGTALEPFPRAPGAELDESVAATPQEPLSGPFAVLARLKKEP